MKREFLLTDKSGRDYIGTVDLAHIISHFENEIAYNGEVVKTWAQTTSEIGDEIYLENYAFDLKRIK